MVKTKAKIKQNIKSKIKPKIKLVENLCNGCDLCCRKYKIYLFPNEAKAIAKKLKINYKNFVENHLDYYFELTEYDNYAKTDFLEVVLKNKKYYLFSILALKQKDGACIFLKNHQCTIYGSRPLICRLFPAFKFYDEHYDFCALDRLQYKVENPRQFYPLLTKYLQFVKHNKLENTWKYLPKLNKENVYLVIDGQRQNISDDLLMILRTFL